MHIIPKGIVSQYIYLRHKHSKSDAIGLMKHFRPVKAWLMSGNPMSLEKCMLKCERWKRKFDIDYSLSDDHQEFTVKMSQLTFRYSSEEKKGYLQIHTNEVLKETSYVFERKQCCNVDRVFTLNERIENMINLPKMIDWLEETGELEKRKKIYKTIEDSIYWWGEMTHAYAWIRLSLYSNKKLREFQNDERIKLSIWSQDFDEQKISFRSDDCKELDRFYASKIMPILEEEKALAEKYIVYLQRDGIVIPNYTKKTQPKDYKDYFYKAPEEYRSICNLLYHTAKNLGMADCYDSRFFYFCFDGGVSPKVLYIHLNRRNLDRSYKTKYVFDQTHDEAQFKKFWEDFIDTAIARLGENIKYIDDTVRKITDRIS